MTCAKLVHVSIEENEVDKLQRISIKKLPKVQKMCRHPKLSLLVL
jgi:hypothetical protein